MLKAKSITAVVITLLDEQATFVQRGESWNGLREMVCVGPPSYDGESMVIGQMDQPKMGRYSLLFDKQLGVYTTTGEHHIVMASEKLGKTLQMLDEAKKAAPAAAEKGATHG